MSYCDGIINANIKGSSCATPAVKGYERVGWIINRKDIDFDTVEFASDKKNVISSLPLVSGAKAYQIEQSGNTPFTGSNTAIEVGTYATTVTNTIQFAILNNDQDTADKIQDSLLNGEFVVILEMKDKGAQSKSAFRVFGFYNGLTLSEHSQDAYGDTYGGSLNTLVETGAPMTALYLGETYAAAKSLLASLVAGASPAA